MAADWDRQLREMELAVDRCLADGLVTPALILLMTAIDCLAWLARPADRDATPVKGKKDPSDVWREDFIAWVDMYLTPDANLPVHAVDLYAARCGLVHTQTAESRSTREGVAREILWLYGADRVRAPGFMDAPDPALLMQLEDFLSAARRGFRRFRSAVTLDPELQLLVERRSLWLFTDGRVLSRPEKGWRR